MSARMISAAFLSAAVAVAVPGPLAHAAARQEQSGAAAAQAPAGQAEAAQVANVGGRWELNWQQSDKPPENIGTPGRGEGGEGEGPRGGRGGRGGGMGGGGRMGRGGGMGRGGEGGGRGAGRGAEARDEMQQLMQPARTLLIVEHPDHVSITDENGQVQKIQPDGTKVKEDRAGKTLERRSRWDGRTLVTEITLSDGTRVTQTYQKVAEGLQLVVTTKVENSRFGGARELKRVYDQAFEK